MEDGAGAQHNIRHARIEDAPAVSSILAEAFSDDPVMVWMFGGAGPIRRLFVELTRDVYLAQGFGHIVDGAAATLWLPPGGKVKLPFMNELRLAAAILRNGGVSALKRAKATAQIVQSNHPQEPHYYLFAVGVVPAHQGEGLGGRIIRSGLERADRDGASAYLENSKPRNTPLYERLGFRPVDLLDLPSGAPPLLGMLRPAGECA